jgi:radical SAM-linked protein
MASTSEDRPKQLGAEHPGDSTADRGSAPGRVDAANAATGARPGRPAPEPRQRWRITYARDAVPPEQVGRAALDSWHASIVGAGLPAATTDGDPSRPRLSFAAPLPAAARGEAELLDLWLVDRLPAWRVREALAPCLPQGHSWLDAEDVWLGAPALPGQVVAADWRIQVAAPASAAKDLAERLVEAADWLTTAPRIERTRMKAGVARPYDLRPLIAAVGIEAGPPLVVIARTRFDPERGSGRPEEVVGAIADTARIPLEVVAMTRVRLLFTADHRSEDARSQPSR